jgi:hypothetical protein
MLHFLLHRINAYAFWVTQTDPTHVHRESVPVYRGRGLHRSLHSASKPRQIFIAAWKTILNTKVDHVRNPPTSALAQRRKQWARQPVEVIPVDFPTCIGADTLALDFDLLAPVSRDVIESSSFQIMELNLPPAIHELNSDSYLVHDGRKRVLSPKASVQLLLQLDLRLRRKPPMHLG